MSPLKRVINEVFLSFGVGFAVIAGAYALGTPGGKPFASIAFAIAGLMALYIIGDDHDIEGAQQ